ncbi:hypothetical protein OXPF_41820 [Oxobacter pfennigii]|uniref:HD domain-containing protein n=1 Tax=Oxobacter pfennigii TaxID=36849 RepID=A0A0P8W1Q6_9CLOT|nr:HD domain-containing protein [Oxobacter pfennigii]KPU42397.1 hypothetical protein OXPF_41820 [Oxobacter pfennigii]
MEGIMISLILNKMILYFDGDIKRINHALKVLSFAKCIGETEKVSSHKLKSLEIAAVLHDIGIKLSEIKYGSSAGKYQEIEGPPVALDILSEFDLDKSILDRIMFLIGNHHTYNKIDDIDFQILVEADFLVNIFEDGMGINEIESVKSKYFKTSTGLAILENMYLHGRAK